ncbi:hypothetical protein DFH09DRAFT_1273263 [Mycena vulgaris]|nr:hypothetical protein DFH09DRAFT_1273263 [Mycena vulgaris]
MQFLTVVLAVLSVAVANGIESDTTPNSESAAAEPGFTWCYEPFMGGRCVSATTLPDQCLNVSLADNDKASSATAHVNSYCTMYNRYNCGTNGETLEILPLARIDRFSDYKFDNRMGSYRCKHTVKPPTDVTCNILVTDLNNGTEYGYISTSFDSYGVYGPLQPTQANALTLSFSYSGSALDRLNLRALNGRTSTTTFPFLGAMDFEGETMGIIPGSPNYVQLVGTCDTPPGGAGILSVNSSWGAATSYPTLIESPIWRYDPATRALAAQWVNPDSSEPETHIAFSVHSRYQDRKLVLASDIPGLGPHYARDGRFFYEVTFKCVQPVTVGAETGTAEL